MKTVNSKPKPKPDANEEVDVGDDLLEGAEAIARFMFKDGRKRKRVYFLTEEARGADKLPCFKIGGVLCARKSTLRAWIAAREAAAAA